MVWIGFPKASSTISLTRSFFREVDQLQALLVKCLMCEIADQERSVVEGNQFGMMISKKHKIDVMPKDEPEGMEGMTSKMIEINKVR